MRTQTQEGHPSPGRGPFLGGGRGGRVPGIGPTPIPEDRRPGGATFPRTLCTEKDLGHVWQKQAAPSQASQLTATLPDDNQTSSVSHPSPPVPCHDLPFPSSGLTFP